MPQALRTLRERFATWALRVRAPEPVPIRLTQRRVYVLPTRAGLLYALSLFVMLVAAINYNLSLGYALVFLLAGLGVVTILHTFRNLAGLSIGIGACVPVFAGQIARFPLVLHSPDAHIRHQIRLSLPAQDAVHIDVPPGEHVRALLPLPTTRRGWLAMPRATIETVWPLNLVRAWSYAAPALPCLVYPRPADTAPPPPVLGNPSGGRWSSNQGDEDFAGLRRHQPGDPPHHVAWKAAARQGLHAALQTKQFSGASAQAFQLDWAALPASMDTETRLAVLARQVLDCEAAGISWGLRLPGTDLARSHGPEHVHTCLKALALHEA